MKNQNESLLEKVDNYRITIQKSLLSTKIPLSESAQMDLDNIESLFQSSMTMYIFVVRFGHENPIDSNHLYNLLLASFDSDTVILALNLSTRGDTYLIGSSNPTFNNPLAVEHVFEPFIEVFSCTYATSRISSNPLDIPRLFEELMISTHQKNIARGSAYRLLDIFVKELNISDYESSRNTLTKLFYTLSTFSYLEFFTQSILIDALTAIVSYFGKYNIDFNVYSDTYYETLYLCRSTDYEQEHDKILTLFLNLLTTLEKKQVHLVLTKDSFTQYMKEEFTNSNLSINEVGDYFQVSGSYISYWFKKNFEENFSDYLWSLRFHHAIELMKNPNLNMTEISEKVGYENYSSFRRKFKSYSSVAPSEYREKNLGLK